MPRFVARPVTIDAVRSDGTTGHLPDHFRAAVRRNNPDGTLAVATAAGLVSMKYGDWLMRGPDGEMHLLSDARFETYFEPVPPAKTNPEPMKRK